MEGNRPHVALGMEEVHDQLALVELEVEGELDELEEGLVELAVAHADGSSFLDFFSKGFLLIVPFAIAVGDGST